MAKMQGSAAQAGFFYQNNLAAIKILECLFFDNDIQSVRLENYDKGQHIDDVIIYRKNINHYFQVKWSEDEENTYTLYSLLTAQPKKKSLLKQLAEGYKSVLSEDKAFEIFLVTTKSSSNGKRPSEGITIGLNDLINGVITPLRRLRENTITLTIDSQYDTVVELLRVESSLHKNEFLDFLSRLTFLFNAESKEQLETGIKNKLSHLGIDPLLYPTLLTAVVKWSISGEPVTKETVLAALGLTDRFEDKISQYFKVVEEQFYVPNSDLFSQLKAALTTLTNGYIFIEGPPGIGKSTALTKFREKHKNIVFSYYCFIPDAVNDFGQMRHKSEYFLKSMCIAIEKEFPNVDLPLKYSNNFEEKLSLYLQTLGTLNKKFIFIIDGLDHVHRDLEFQPGSLLNQIKGGLPDGIFFLLSSQYKDVLSGDVWHTIRAEPLRHIKVPPFRQQQITEYLLKRGIDNPEIVELAERVSGGIPIYLHYITELLLNSEHKQHETLLDDLPALIDGKIATYHEYLYQQIENDPVAQRVLAILAHRREYSDTACIVTIMALLGMNTDISSIEAVIRRFGHLLRQQEAKGFAIFHNSFREFILSKTHVLKTAFNTALSEYYNRDPYTDEAYRNYFRHLFELKEYALIIETTTINWIKDAWKNFRTIAEIKSNIKIAWAACAELGNLTSFVRIAYLKAQVDRLDWNLEHSDYNASMLFLNAGLISNSIRSIWDGDFVTVRKSYFGYYLEQYYGHTGDLLPRDIINQGFSKNEGEDLEFEDIVDLYVAEILVLGDARDVFQRINKINWTRSDQRDEKLLRKSKDRKITQEQNFKVKVRIIQILKKHKKYKLLDELVAFFKEDTQLALKARTALVEILLPADQLSALNILMGMSLTELSERDFGDLVAFCADHLDDRTIQTIFPARELKFEDLYDNVIDEKNGMDYSLRKSIINSANELKALFIFDQPQTRSFLLRSSALPRPAKDFYNASYEVASVWYMARAGESSRDTLIWRVKDALKGLFVPSAIIQMRQNNRDGQLFERSFISRSLSRFYRVCFTIICTVFTQQEVLQIIRYWLTLERSGDGYRHYDTGLVIAKVIQANKKFDIPDTLFELITYAEEIARLESETATLTDYLIDVAETYAICGFSEHFKRIYDQLLESSFGVGSRKDYQFSYILEPQNEINILDPTHALTRFKDLFEDLAQLSEAGNARMVHINLSELIAVVGTSYPELALKLVASEERHIDRTECLGIVLKRMIEKARSADLDLYFAIIKTLPRWKSGASANQQFLSLSGDLIKMAVSRGRLKMVDLIMELVVYHITTEAENPEEFDRFRNILLELGMNPLHFGIPEPAAAVNMPSKHPRPPQDEKFLLPVPKPDLPLWVSLFNSDYTAFEAVVDNIFSAALKNRRLSTIRNEYYRSKNIFEDFYANYQHNQPPLDAIGVRAVIRAYLAFGHQLVAIKEKIINSREAGLLFDGFIATLDHILGNSQPSEYVKSTFKSGEWIRRILKFTNEHFNHVFSKAIPADIIYELIGQVSILKMDQMVAFLNKYTFENTLAAGLMKIAIRIAKLDIHKSMAIMEDIDIDAYNNPFFADSESSKESSPIFKLFLEEKLDYGKQFLLKSFIRYKGGSSILDNIDLLVPFAPYFSEDQFINDRYQANRQYNQELSKGLARVETAYEFILDHTENSEFEQVTLNYLLSLFDYAIVRVRELTLQALFDLFCMRVNLPAKLSFSELNHNQIEHVLTVLQAVALQSPENIRPLKMKLWALAELDHFHIRQLVRELLFLLHRDDKTFLDNGELVLLQKINTASQIILPPAAIPPLSKTGFVYNGFLRSLLSDLAANFNGPYDFKDLVYTDLNIHKDLGAYTFAESSRIHRTYNINTNFNTLEIFTPYDDEVRDSLNKLFGQNVKKGEFDADFVASIANRFRLFDPSFMLFRPMNKPLSINWLPDIEEDKFITFADLPTTFKQFISRETNYIPLYEQGSQRPSKEYHKNDFATEFTIFAFLADEKLTAEAIRRSIGRYNPYGPLNNTFLYELPKGQFKADDFPIPNVVPLLEITSNNFRMRDLTSNVCLITDIEVALGIKPANGLTRFLEHENAEVETTYWAGPYSSGRRRYIPTFTGISFKIQRVLLLNYLQKNKLGLFFHVAIERSTDKYKEDFQMDWHSYNQIIKADL